MQWSRRKRKSPSLGIKREGEIVPPLGFEGLWGGGGRRLSRTLWPKHISSHFPIRCKLQLPITPPPWLRPRPPESSQLIVSAITDARIECLTEAASSVCCQFGPTSPKIHHHPPTSPLLLVLRKYDFHSNAALGFLQASV